MATFAFKKRGYTMPYHVHTDAAFKVRIDLPALIANGGLVNTSGADVALPTTGFAAADILQVFSVPAGFWLHAVGVRVVTAEGAACTADLGNASATQTHVLGANADGYMGTINLNSAVTQITLVADDGLGRNTGAGTGLSGVVFVTDGTIDMTFGSADTNAAIFDVWAIGWKCW
jgi:hypothetical protein